MPSATWSVTGNIFNSDEDITYGSSPLSVSYTDNVDTRWSKAVLGPLINVLDFAAITSPDAIGGTPATCNTAALSGTMNATDTFLYVARGNRIVKIELDDMDLHHSDFEAPAAITCLLYCKNKAGTQEIGIFYGGSEGYDVLTTSANAGSADTVDVGNSTVFIRIAFYGGSTAGDGMIAGLGQGTTAVENYVGRLVLSTTVSLITEASWATVNNISGERIVFTAGGLDSYTWILGTSEGPYYNDEGFTQFYPLIHEIDPNLSNCRFIANWYPIGLIMGMARGTRWLRAGEGGPIGPETYPANTSPIQGPMTAGVGLEAGFLCAVQNLVTRDTYLCFCRERRAGDFGPGNARLAFYSLAKFTAGVDPIGNVGFLAHTGTAGGRTNPTVIGGNGTNGWWMTMGLIPREIDDTGYRYAAAGTWVGTRLRRNPGQVKRPTKVRLITSSCTANLTVTVSISVIDPQQGTTFTQALGGAIITNGLAELDVPDDENLYGYEFYPSFALATNSSSSSPAVEGTLTVEYDLLDYNPNADNDL